MEGKNICNQLKEQKRKKGITLIALVVTLVVLLILAGISIMVLFGDNGVIKTAKEAGDTWNKAAQKEQTDMHNLAGQMNGLINGIGGTTNPDDQTKDWDLTKVDKVTSEDNVVVPVPKGFVVSTIDGEKKVADGFVIKQGTDGSKKEGINEFVWVPITEGKPMFATRTETVDGIEKNINIGQLYNFSGTTSTPITYSASGCHEPDILTSDANTTGINQLKDIVGIAGTTTEEILANWKTQLQKEFDEMKASVEKYGGFYIGRYETGDINQNKLVVQKNNTDINSVSQDWYMLYQKSKSVAEGTKVKSNMVWDCQWDACMNWFLTNDKTKAYVTNSTDKGSYSGLKLTNGTGSNENYQLNNIYDMAGSVWEWTIGCGNTDSRTIRRWSYL